MNRKLLLFVAYLFSPNALSAQTLELKKNDGQYIHLRSLEHQMIKKRPQIIDSSNEKAAERNEPPADRNELPEILPQRDSLVSAPAPVDSRKSQSVTPSGLWIGIQHLWIGYPEKGRDRQLMVEGLLSRHDTLGFHYGQGVLTSDQVTAYISGQHLGLHFRNYRLRPLYIETSLTTFQGGLTTNNDFHVDLDDENLRILWLDLAFGLKIQGKGVYLDLRLFNFRKYEHQSYLKKTERSLVGPAGIGLGFAL